MKELTLQDLYILIEDCKNKNLPLDTPVFIGDDEELNNIHTAFFAQVIRKDNKGDDYYFERIHEASGNAEAKDINILIS